MTVMRPLTLGSSTTVVPRMVENSSTMSRSSALFIASCHFCSSAINRPGTLAKVKMPNKTRERSRCAPVKLFMELITLTARKQDVENV